MTSLWNENIEMLRKAPPEMQVQLDVQTERAIERFVSFVDGCIDSDEDAVKHPLWGEFRNWADWNLTLLVSKASDLTSVMVCDGFERVRGSIGKPDRYEDIMAEVQFAAELMRAGFTVRFVKESKGEKTPDLEAQLGSDTIRIELTRIGRSATTQEVFSFIDAGNWDMPEFDGLAVELRLLRIASEPRRTEIRQKLAEVARRVHDTGEAQAFSIEKLAEGSIAPARAPGGRTIQIGGPNIGSDETGRVAHRIREKAHQLPSNVPGFVVIFDSELTGLNSSNGAAFAEAIEERVFEHPHLGALLVAHSYIDFRVESLQVRRENWAMWRKIGPGFYVEERLLILNKYARWPVNQKLLQALGCPSE